MEDFEIGHPSHSETYSVTQGEVRQWMDETYKVTTVVPVLRDATMNVYYFTQEEFDDFLDGYSEFAEFIVAVEHV